MWEPGTTVAHTRPAVPKMSWTPSAIPKKGASQAPSDKPSPSGESKSLAVGTSLRDSRKTGLNASDMNAGLPNPCLRSSTDSYRKQDLYVHWATRATEDWTLDSKHRSRSVGMIVFLFYFSLYIYIYVCMYVCMYPTTPHEQDLTLGQYLSGI